MNDRQKNYDTTALALKALDQLRCALDKAICNNDEQDAGLLIGAIRDLAETIDLINRKRKPDTCGSGEDDPFTAK